MHPATKIRLPFDTWMDRTVRHSARLRPATPPCHIQHRSPHPLPTLRLALTHP